MAEEIIMSRAEALEFLLEDDKWVFNGHTKVDDIHMASSRWSEHRRVVITRLGSGKYFTADYERGLTENQYIVPWEYMDDVIFTEADRIPRTVYEYRRVR